MNFQKIPPVISSKEILDIAFRKARVRGRQTNLKGNWLQIIRKKESLKLDIIKDSVETCLQKIIVSFPQLNELPLFYSKLMKLTLDTDKFKQALRDVTWIISKNRELHRQAVRLVNTKTTREEIKKTVNHYYGRISSLVKELKNKLNYLELCRQRMRTYPDIKEMFTVCIYGFPNVGKTTLLNKLTSSQAKVAAYPFTTITINAGYINLDHHQVQVLDVPGTLDRDKLNLIEQQAELVLKELADVVIYVYDITETCGYSLKQQQQLQERLKGREVLVYLSKKDLMNKADLAKLRITDHSIEEIKKEIRKRL